MNEKTYLIPESVLRAVVNYLSSRPYSEVHQAIPALVNLREAPAQQDPNDNSKAG